MSFMNFPIKTVVDFKVLTSIQKNTTIALVGKSGSGKTTITDLISLEATSGTILIDRKPSAKIDRRGWRRKLDQRRRTRLF